MTLLVAYTFVLCAFAGVCLVGGAYLTCKALRDDWSDNDSET